MKVNEKQNSLPPYHLACHHPLDIVGNIAGTRIQGLTRFVPKRYLST
jgi:hypothetical protein